MPAARKRHYKANKKVTFAATVPPGHSCFTFFASGNFQTVTADHHVVSKDSISRIVRDVPISLVERSPSYIKVPNNETAITNTMFNFSRICGFTNVIGLIYGTRVGIKSLSIEENVFLNRKNNHSVNIMTVCDANLKFVKVGIWRGSSHDSFVWIGTIIYMYFANFLKTKNIKSIAFS